MEGIIAGYIPHTLMRVGATFAKSIATIGIVVGLWFFSPGVITGLMDFNLALIKWTAVTLPYGGQIELALRYLAGEKSFVFLEVLVALNITLIILRFCGRMCWRGCRLTFCAFRRRFAG